MTMPTAAEITRLYLWGTTTLPNNLADDNRIRPLVTQASGAVIREVDINDYMDNGPGRFVNAAAFEVIGRFFSNAQAIPPGTYTKENLFTMWGMLGNEQINRRSAFISQSDYADSKDDLLERAYIWQTTGFQIDDRARFVVATNGSRTITNFGIKQYSSESKGGITPADTENFDFTGGGTVSNFAGGACGP